MTSGVPPFVTSFRKRFGRTLTVFIRSRNRSGRRLDRRLATFTGLTFGTLSGGKRLRPLLVELGYEAFGGRTPSGVAQAGLAVELFHSFALVHDDIIDRADERRGIPTVQASVTRSTKNSHAGIGTAILSGDLLLVIADRFDRIPLPVRRRELARAAFQTMAEETILGQQLEFDLSRNRSVRLKDVVRVMIYKSGRYSIEWPLTIGAILAGAPPRQLSRLSAFSIPLGLAFQLRDDILGTFGDPKITGKSRDSDIREGKRTLLVCFADAALAGRERRFFWRTLGNMNAAPRDVARVRSLMRSSGAYQQALDLASDLTDMGLDAIRQSGLTERAVRKLDALARYLLDRTT